jgi:hypothetical protein
VFILFEIYLSLESKKILNYGFKLYIEKKLNKKGGNLSFPKNRLDISRKFKNSMNKKNQTKSF